MKVLVAFASRHGATKGIAERIATTLEHDGFDVTLRSVDTVGPIDAFDAVVIGSAAYLGGWLSEATTFVRRNRKGLASRPLWLFSSGPTSTGDGGSQGPRPVEDVRTERVRGVLRLDSTTGHAGLLWRIRSGRNACDWHGTPDEQVHALRARGSTGAPGWRLP